MAKADMLVYRKEHFSEVALSALENNLRSILAQHESRDVIDLRVAEQKRLRQQEGIWQAAVAGKVPIAFESTRSAEQGLGREYGVERYTTFAPLLVWHPNLAMLEIVSKNIVLERKTLAVLFARTDITEEQRNELVGLQQNHYGSSARFNEIVAAAKGDAQGLRNRLLANERRDDFFVNYQRELVRNSLAA